MITLADVLACSPMAAADPLLRTAVPDSLARAVRWVHSSEVLEVAPLLRGGELLLSGGRALFGLSPEGQEDYVRSLGARGLAALALETAGLDGPLPERIITAAQDVGLPLIELRRVAPFVDIAEEVNRLVVNEQAAAHLVVDDISRRIAHLITDRGPHLPTILDLISESLNVEVTLTSSDGAYLGRAGNPIDAAAGRVVSGIVLGGQLAAELTLASSEASPALLDLAADRLSGILALAMAQSFHPTPAQVADTRLLQAIIDDAGPGAVQRFWAPAGMAAGQSAIMAVFRTPAGEADFSGIERTLRASGVVVKTHLWDGELTALFVVPAGRARRERAALLLAARAAIADLGVCAAFGPTARNGFHAHDSYAEALEVMRIGSPGAGEVLDAMDFLGRRILDEVPNAGFMDAYVQTAVGDVIDWDRKYGAALTGSLLCWLESGCNTTAAASALHIERQTMHKRLSKIHELLGEDPRTAGNLFTIHLAVRAAMSDGSGAGLRRLTP